MRRLLLSVLLAAGTAASLGSPAAAQSAADDQRFDAAQSRFDSELQRYQAEVRRYRDLRGQDGDQSYSQPSDGYRRPGAYSPPPGGYAPPPGGYDDDRDEAGYDPTRHYRSGSGYQERVLASDDRVYRGSDGRYYCQRNDGTTGLIVGAAGGGVLGNVIDGGHSRTVGTLIGGAIGALAGRAVEQQQAQVRCR